MSRRARLLAVRRALVPAVAVVVLAAGCSEDPYETYCAEVEDRQAELGEIVAEGGPAGLIEALGPFRELADKAPRDIRDEWDLVIRRIELLERALEDAGVDPATYDRDDPPPGLSDAERSRIDAAATELASPTTRAALEGLQQQARDVCKTPLTL